MATQTIEKVAVRNLINGSVLANTGETVIAVRQVRTTNPKFDRTHRAVCLQNAEGRQRWAEWNAGTMISVVTEEA